MLSRNLRPNCSGGGAARPKSRRGRLTPVRRIRRVLATGLCAGATLLSGALAAQAQQPVTPVGYHAAVRGHSGHSYAGHGHAGHGHGHYCPPPCHSYPHTHAPNYYAPHLPGQPQAPTEAPRPGQQDQAATPDAAADMGLDATQTPPSAAPAQAPAPSFSSASGATGTASAPSSATPNAIGDFFGNVTSSHPHGPQIIIPGFINPAYVDPTANVVGRVKASENNSPIPTDRIFLDFAAYQNVPLTGGFGSDIDVERFVPGFEKTFFDGAMSLEMRLPIARTLGTNFATDGPVDGDEWEVGNLYFAAKTLLYQDDVYALTAGLGISTPTGDDIEIYEGGVLGAVVENEAVHLLPFFGFLHTPNDTFYSQAYIQVDVDANGNPIVVGDDVGAVVQGQTLLYLDYILGAWLWHDPCSRGLQGVVGTTELHYTTAIQDFDAVAGADVSVDAIALDDFDFLTGIVGVHLLYASGAQVTFGYGAPLMSQRFADGEFRMMLNLGGRGLPRSLGGR